MPEKTLTLWKGAGQSGLKRQPRYEYKVWICVEEHDLVTDKYTDIDPGFEATATFSGGRRSRLLQKAEQLAGRLDDIGRVVRMGSGCEEEQIDEEGPVAT